MAVCIRFFVVASLLAGATVSAISYSAAPGGGTGGAIVADGGTVLRFAEKPIKDDAPVLIAEAGITH